MLLTDAFCYAVFLISATASCFRHEMQSKDLASKQIEKRMIKREAAILIDNFPLESRDLHKPNVIFKRISRQRYRYPHKPSAQSAPPRIKYGVPKATRKPYKKYKVKKVNPKYGMPPKKYSPKPKYERPSKPPKSKQEHGSRQRRPQRLQSHTPHSNTYYENKIPDKNALGFAEPPVGRPEPNVEVLPAITNPGQSASGPDLQDHRLAYSNKINTFSKPEIGVAQQGAVFDEGEDLDTYADIFKYSEPKPQMYNIIHSKKRPDFLGDIRKLINRPWKAPMEKDESQLLVGGQYAEPPARYVSKLKSNDEMYVDDEETIGTETKLDNPVSTYSVSPYVNYKNSNMAFSPQNLNDAFSIVDK